MSKEFLDTQATIECGFSLKRVRDMIRTYRQMHRTDKYSQHSSVIWSVLLNSWVFVYELSGRWFEPRCSHLNFRYYVCFEKGVPWHSGNYRVWSHFETRTWHDRNGSKTIVPEENCPLDNCPPRVIAPWKLAVEDNYPRG